MLNCTPKIRKGYKNTAKEHRCITHRHRQQCGDGRREEGWGLGGSRQEGGKWALCNSINNKNKGKKVHLFGYINLLPLFYLTL